MKLLNQQLEQQAISDPLTGLPNHQALAGYLEAILPRTREEQQPCSLLFIDLDHFKRVNDEHGHLVGDMVLCQFGALVASTLRATDYLGRWGGEEFIAVLPGASTRDASVIAERIRLRVARHTFTGDSVSLHLTCSVGVATSPDDAREEEALMREADTAMYLAKRRGRNQVRTAHEPDILMLRTTTAPVEHETLPVVEGLMALQEGQDYPIGQHERRVASLSLCLARSLGLSEGEACMVSLGGLLHDLGKAALPGNLLPAYEHRADEQAEPWHEHPVIGAEVLRVTLALYEVAAIVRSHHERMDGSGYPDHLRGEEIPLGARIVAVADIYDMLTHYQQSSPAEALFVLQKSAGTQFDPHVVHALQQMLSANPAQQMRQAV